MKEKESAKCVIERIAHMHGVSEAEVYLSPAQALDMGKHSLDPVIQRRWEAMDRIGRDPSLTDIVACMAVLGALRRDDEALRP